MRNSQARPIPVFCTIAICLFLLALIFSFADKIACKATAKDVDHCAAAIPPDCVPGSCTIFTAARGDRVLFGNNEDWINPNTYCWAVPAEGRHYGGVYFGFDNFWPQGGINEKGLAYDINALPRAALKPRLGRHKVKNPCQEILKTCATVEEAVDMADRLYLGNTMSCQVHFADATGAAAVMSAGSDGEIVFTRKPKGDGFLVSTNFNRANPQNGRYPCRRYDKAVAMLKTMQDQGVLSVARFRDILDEVHQEGPFVNTVYSNVFDLKEGIIHLFHWHQFDEVIELHVSEEMNKAGPPRRIRDFFSEETVEKASVEYRTYRRTITTWKTVVWIWLALAAGSLGLLMLGWAHRMPVARRAGLARLLSAVVLGPLGVAAYWKFSRGAQGTGDSEKTPAAWQEALGATAYGVTAHALGITGAFFTIFFIQPAQESSLWSLLARFYGFPLIGGILAFHSPLWSFRSGRSFLKGLRRNVLFDIVFTNTTLVGMFPTSCILVDVCGRQLGLSGPGNVLFWGVMAAGALAGVLTAYPLNAWMTHRGYAWWPIKEGVVEKSVWGFLLVSTALLFGAVLLVLALVE